MNWKKDLNWTNVGFATAFLILLTLSLLSYHMFHENIENRNLVDHTHEVLHTSKDLVSNVTDAESGQRGFLLTGNEDFLEPFYRSVERNELLLNRLRDLTRDNAHQQHRCAVATGLLHDKMLFIRTTIRLRRQQRTDEMLQLINSGKGNELMDDIREVFNAIDHEEQSLLKLRKAQTNRSEIITRPLMVSGMILSITILVIIYIALHRQIRSRIEKETELRVSREWLSIMLSSIGDGVIATDEHFIISFMNPVAEELTGWKEDDARGKSVHSVFNIINEYTRKRVENPVVTAIAENRVVTLADNTILIRKDNTEINIDDSGSPIMGADGTIRGAILIFRDITEKKRTEQELNMFFDITLDLVGMANADSYFTKISPSVQNILGYTEEQFLTRSFMDLVHPDDISITFQAMTDLSAGKTISNFINRYLCSDGTYKWLEWNLSPQNGIFFSMARDITQRKEEEEALIELHTDLKSKNQEILDSLSYAKRIQTAFLPDLTVLNDLLPDSFILYKPKDIVSGDFYWTHKEEGKILLAVADCTGHGVPGALLSIIGSQKLDEASEQCNDVSTILNYLNMEIKASLKQLNDKHSSRDGMDIALCCLQFHSHGEQIHLSYAGANRPIWIVREGQDEIEQLKGTKTALGGLTDVDQHFESRSLTLKRGDTIYMFTDGYVDQFGGDRGKKLMTKKFREILLSIRDRSMREQGHYLESFIENWRAGSEQIDDMLVIGVRV